MMLRDVYHYATKHYDITDANSPDSGPSLILNRKVAVKATTAPVE